MRKRTWRGVGKRCILDYLTSNLFIEVIKSKDKMNSFGPKTYEDIWSEMGFEVSEESIVPIKIKTDVKNASHQIMTL